MEYGHNVIGSQSAPGGIIYRNPDAPQVMTGTAKPGNGPVPLMAEMADILTICNQHMTRIENAQDRAIGSGPNGSGSANPEPASMAIVLMNHLTSLRERLSNAADRAEYIA